MASKIIGEQIKADRSRECAACGGCGYCGGKGIRVSVCPCNASKATHLCCVCLGSGRIVDDSTGQRDADADAETLRKFLPKFPPTPDYFGEVAILRISRGVASGHDSAQERGRFAARAAFRSVPGLRGE